MHSQLTHIAARQHIAELHRAADHNRLVQAATTAAAATPPTAPSPSRPVTVIAGSAAASLDRTRQHGTAGQVEG